MTTRAHLLLALFCARKFVGSNNLLTSFGKPALPPILPAIANAVFTATNERIRMMPMMKQDVSFA